MRTLLVLLLALAAVRPAAAQPVDTTLTDEAILALFDGLRVADVARKTLDADKSGRRQLYEQLGRPLDETVRENDD